MTRHAVIRWIVGCVWTAVLRKCLEHIPVEKGSPVWRLEIGLFFLYSLHNAQTAGNAYPSAHSKPSQ